MNCLIYKNEHLKITNFQYSRFFGDNENDNSIKMEEDEDLYKQDIDICDGIHYMSPEYIEEKHSSPSMDLWALGCIIFEMLTGEKPFDSTCLYKKYYPFSGRPKS